eukprot:gene3716-4236_t
MAAVALQDHITRSLSLSDPFKRKTIEYGRTVKDRTSSLPKARFSKQGIKTKSSSSKESGLLDANDERVLDTAPKPLTLAQRLGMIDAPRSPLSEEQWKEVKHFSNSRNDSMQPCAICQDNFALKEQICLNSFERFSGKKSCPMCRKEQYQTRLIYEGRNLHLIKSATMIQACWHGYKVRCWYKKIRESVAPKDPRLRKAFFEKKLTSLTERMIDSVDQHSYKVDDIINSIDESLAYSKNILSQLENPHCDSFIDWNEVKSKAKKLNMSECPICMTSFKEVAKEPRPIALLSCCHVYHFACLKMYEDCYALANHPHCPVCRAMYSKIKLSTIWEAHTSE